MEIQTSEEVTVTQTSFVVNQQKHKYNKHQEMDQLQAEEAEVEEEEDDDEEDEEDDQYQDQDPANLSIEEMELPETIYRSRHHEILNALVDDGEDYGDIQFFHHHSQIQQHLQQQQQQQNEHQHQQQQHANGNGDYEMDVSGITGSSQNKENSDYSNSTDPYNFPEMEAQFFPGIQHNCVGYLETILEETDEEYDEEAESSGANWWAANSDTDTDSVIRLENNISSKNSNSQPTNNQNMSAAQSGFKAQSQQHQDHHSRNEMENDNNGKMSNNNNTFRTTASSRPFEMEDLHLLDQLDLAFEETLMESFGGNKLSNQNQKMSNMSMSLNDKEHVVDDPFLFNSKTPTFSVAEANEATVFTNLSTSFREHDMEEKSLIGNFGNGGKKGFIANSNSNSSSISTNPNQSSPTDIDEEEVQPQEVNEEDFFYTTSEESEGSTEETSSATSSSDEDGGSGGNNNKKDDGVVVLAEFSLNSSFNSAVSNKYRRSFEGCNNKSLRSFRSFDSLNSLAGTELLFSKGDTFPSFHYIKEVAEPSSSSPTHTHHHHPGVESVGIGIGIGGSRDRKNSDSSAEQMSSSGDRPTEMSTENLSEDSGIGADGSSGLGSGSGSGLNLNLNLNPFHNNKSVPSSIPNSSSNHHNDNNSVNCQLSANIINDQSINYITKSEFALNPFVYSSASEENSMSSASLFHIHDSVTSASSPSDDPKNINSCSIIKNEHFIPQDSSLDMECLSVFPITNTTSTKPGSSSSTITTTISTLSNDKPDVLAQCTNNYNQNDNDIMLAGKRQSAPRESSSSFDNHNDKNVEPQVIPPHNNVIKQQEERDNDIDIEIEGLTPFVHTSSSSSSLDKKKCKFPTLQTKNSEVLLKFVDEDEDKKIMECGDTYDDVNMNTNTSESEIEQEEVQVEMIEEGEELHTHANSEKLQVLQDNNNDDVDGANSVNAAAAAAHMLIESESQVLVQRGGGEQRVCECSRIIRGRGMAVESGPMSALSCTRTCICISTITTSAISDTRTRTHTHAHTHSHSRTDDTNAARMTMPMTMTMDSPSLAQNNNSISTSTVSETESAVKASSLLLENELPSTTTCTNTTTTTDKSFLYNNNNNGDSVCVQKSSWTDVAHHNEPRLFAVPPHNSDSEFISGSSNFGSSSSSSSSSSVCTEKNTCTSVEGNLDTQSISNSKSLAPTEHLCNSNTNDENQEEKINKKTHHPITNDGKILSKTHANIISPSDVLLEKQGVQCSSSSINRSCTPDESHNLIVPDYSTLNNQDNNKKSGNNNKNNNNNNSEYSELILSGSPTTTTTTMEVDRRRNPSSSPPPPPPSSSIQHQQPIKTKTYGPRNEVEVYLLSSRTPSPSPIMKPTTSLNNEEMSSSSISNDHTNNKDNSKLVKKEVHFSPVVSEISWRESYTDQGSEASGSSDNLLDEQESSVDGPLHYTYNSASGQFDMNVNVKQSVKVQEQVTQPIENVVLLPTNNSIVSNVYEDVGDNNSNSDLKSTHQTSSRSNNKHNINNPQPTRPSTLSMVPDLLSQCENASQSHTHITVNIEERQASPLQKHQQQQPTLIPPQQQQQQQPQQQIFPSIFADKNEGKNSSKLNKSSKKSSSKSFNIPTTSGKSEKEKEKEKERQNTKDNKENRKDDESQNREQKATKPGFFERLSKIRLSGGSKNKNKKKIHPSEKENLPISTSTTSNITLTSDDSSSSSVTAGTKNTTGKSPILKKYPANAPKPPQQQQQQQRQQQSSVEDTNIDVEKTNEAFANILEDIAGINTIKMRQQQFGRRSTSPSQTQTQTLNQNQNQHDKNTNSISNTKVRSFAEKKQFFVESPGRGNSPSELDTKLSQFKEDISEVREVISKSHPDLEVIEGVVRDRITTPEPKVQHTSPHLNSSSSSSNSRINYSSSSPPPPPTSTPEKTKANTNHSTPDLYEQKTEREWYKLLKSAAEKYYYRGDRDKENKDKDSKEKKVKTAAAVVETDLDTVDSELILNKVPSSTAVKTRSLTNLSSSKPLSLPLSDHLGHVDLDHPDNKPLQGELSDDERAKSLEYLLDENNKSSSVPPENNLRLETRQLSHHELRIQRSLAALNVPEWYKKAAASPNNQDEGTLSKNSSTTKSSGNIRLGNRSPFGSSSRLAGGWQGLGSKNPSLSSLQNSGRYSGSLNRSNNYFVRGRPQTMSVGTRNSRESLLSPSSTASQSPSAFERCSFTYGMPFNLTRFNNGRLSIGSNTSSPPSTPGTASGPTYVKKPYLGWRSQERLNAGNTTAPNAPLRLSMYRPPAERLAAEVLSNRNRSERPNLPKPPPRAEKTVLTNKNPQLVPANTSSPSSDVHESIREVTEQINQFVHQNDQKRSNSTMSPVEPPKPKPRQKQGGRKTNVWIESSFVGSKPNSID